jgi:copper(I)-binding protein
MTMRRISLWIVALGAMLALAMAGSLAAQSGQQIGGTPAGHGGHGGMMATPGAGGMGTMGQTGNGVVYLTITNDGDADDALLGGATDRAQRVEVHQMTVENQVARMQPVDGPLPIPAGETVSLEPGGLHMMLVNLTDDNVVGDVFELTLEFEQAGEVTIEVPVRLDAEPADNEVASETVEAGDLTIEVAWSRPAPMLMTGGHMMGTPAATPEATPSS